MLQTESKTYLDKALLHELIDWIKELNKTGVSYDTAAQVASEFFLAGMMESCDDEFDLDDLDDDDDDDYED